MAIFWDCGAWEGASSTVGWHIGLRAHGWVRGPNQKQQKSNQAEKKLGKNKKKLPNDN